MPAADSPTLIVARYLKSNNYDQSYEAFISEAGLSDDAGNTSRDDLTLERLLEEKRTFDVAVQFEKLGVDDGVRGWFEPAPKLARQIESLSTPSNILSVQLENFPDLGPSPSLFVTTADRKLYMIDVETGAVQQSFSALHDSPILSCIKYGTDHLLTASMSGHLAVSSLQGEVLDKRKDHNKYIVKIAITSNPDETTPTLIATAGWDCKICIYTPSPTSSTQLGDPTATIDLPTKPESMLFLRHPDNNRPILLISRTDSSCIFYYTTEHPPRLLGQQNLSPHSNAWVAFTPSALALHPTDPTLLAVGTSSTPHMRLLIVRLLIPPWNTTTSTPTDPEPTSSTPATALARATQATADRDAAAILIQGGTQAPQTAYSTPAVAWRADGTGVWVNGDDGAVRGLEARSGRVVAVLSGRDGHEAGSRVRCLCAGRVADAKGGEEEVLVSGGFDRRLIVWRV